MTSDRVAQRIAARKAELDRLRRRAPHGLDNLDHAQDVDATLGEALSALQEALPAPADRPAP